MQYNAQITKSQTGWNPETLVYEGPVQFTVWCPSPDHRKAYQGESRTEAEAILAEHADCVPVQDENLAVAFSTVAGHHTVSMRFMKPEDLRKSHGGRYTRTYVSIEDVDLGDHPPYSVKGEDPTNDAAWRAYNHRELVAMKLKLSRVRPVLEATFGMAPGAQWSFSRKAGCSCPCSPGFILKGYQVKVDHRAAPTRVGGTYRQPVDIWVG